MMSFIGFIIGGVLSIICVALSWITTCGIVKLITWCFGWTFSWAVATGIWALILLFRSIFGN